MVSLWKKQVFYSKLKTAATGTAVIVFSVKNGPNFYLHSIFLNLRQDLECLFVWNVLTKEWSSWPSSSFERKACTYLSTNSVYSLMFSPHKLGGLNIQTNEWVWGQPVNWNSTRIP